MGYTSKDAIRTWDAVWTMRDSGIDTTVIQHPTATSTFFSRNGTVYNSTKPRVQGKKSRYYYWAKVVRPIPLTYKKRVFQPMLQKWVTETKTRERYVWIKVAIPRSKRPSPPFLNVNNLSFESQKFVDHTPVGDITVTGYGPSWGSNRKRSWYYHGPIGYIGSGYPSGWGSGNLDRVQPASYGSSDLFTRYASIIDSLQAKSLEKMYEKVKSQEINLLNVIGERRQTMEMFTEVIGRVAKTLALIKRGRLVDAARRLFPGSSHQLANDVLLLNFGIKPLLSDVEGAARAVASMVVGGKDVVVFKTSRKERVEEGNQSFSSNSTILVRDQIVNVSAEITVKRVIRVRIDNSGIVDQAKKLGLFNIPSTIWELTPWSFAIDWLIPIGDWINSYDAFAGLTVESHHVTTVVKQRVECISTHSGVTGEYFGYDASTSGGQGKWVKENIKVVRAVQSVLIPPIQFPSFRNPFTTNRLVNSLALLRQLR